MGIHSMNDEIKLTYLLFCSMYSFAICSDWDKSPQMAPNYTKQTRAFPLPTGQGFDGDPFENHFNE